MWNSEDLYRALCQTSVTTLYVKRSFRLYNEPPDITPMLPVRHAAWMLLFMLLFMLLIMLFVVLFVLLQISATPAAFEALVGAATMGGY